MGELRKGNLCLSTTYGLHHQWGAADANALWLCLSTPQYGLHQKLMPAPTSLSALPQHTSYGLHRVMDYEARLKAILCLSTLHMGCTGKTAQRHGYSIVKCAVRG